MAKPGNPYHDPATGEFTSGPSGGVGRWQKMSKREKARLRAQGQFRDIISPHTKKKTRGMVPAKLPRVGFEAAQTSTQAELLQTARALDRDFHYARDKAAQKEMMAALERHRAKLKSK